MSDHSLYQINLYREENQKIESFLQKNGSVFHSFSYLNAVGDNYLCIVIEQNEIILAALPLVKTTKHKITGYHIPPYTHIFGPVVNIFYKERCVELTLKLLQSLPKAAHYDFKMYNNGDVIPYLQNGFSLSVLQSHLLPCNREFKIIEHIGKDKKRDIQKLEKLVLNGDIRIIENDIHQHTHFVDLWKKTSERASFDAKIGIMKKVISCEIPFYSNIIFDKEGNAIAGTFCPMDNRNMYHILGMGIRSNDKLLSRANILSLYYALNYASKKNLNFDFEGSSLPGVAQFYRMMGGEPITMLRVQKSRSPFYHLLRFVNVIKTERKINK